MKYINKLLIIFILAILTGCNGAANTKTQIPIFSNVGIIGVNYSDSQFIIDLPDTVSYAVLGIFNSEIEADDENKTVDDGNLIAGSRTGLSGYARNRVSVNNLFTYDAARNDFTNTRFTPVTGTEYCWAVWGFDQWGNLTHASQSQKENF